MKNNKYIFSVCTAIFLSFCLLGCEEKNLPVSDTPRETVTAFLEPNLSGTITYGTDSVNIDASNTEEGYVSVDYHGDADKVKMQITNPDQTLYTYTLKGSDIETFPLSGGNGSYHMDVLEQVSGDLYALAFSQDLDVSIENEFGPFLYPNQYVWYEPGDSVVAFGKKLSEESYSDLEYIQNVYDYVITHITYDEEKAAHVPTDYVPDVNETLASGKGICFDYASLMGVLLRSQGIPTKLVVGYSGTVYHAWISVYIDEIGWVDNIIEFNGKSWTLMDPTLAADNDARSVQKYTSDGRNYTVKYNY